MKQIKIIFTLLLGMSLFSGCIKDDLEDCIVEGKPLYFSYLGDINREIFPQKINEVNLYVYDQAESLVQTIILNKTDLNTLQGTKLDLPNGNYHIVCWGNVFSETQVNNELSRGPEAFVSTPEFLTDETITTNDSLYFGSLDIQITNDIIKPDTVYFKSSHIKMLVKLEGLDDYDVSPVKLQIENLSPTVDFYQKYSADTTSYYPVISRDNAANDFIARFNVLRFNNDNNINIKLINTESGKIIYTLKLKDFLAQNSITVNGINEAFVGIAFWFNGLGVTVKPWDEENITPGI